MTDRSTIVSEIRARSEGSYDSWHVGVTQDPDAAAKFWEQSSGDDIALWMEWQADSIEEAEAIASHFVSLGVMPGPPEDLDPDGVTYVYVF